MKRNSVISLSLLMITIACKDNYNENELTQKENIPKVITTEKYTHLEENMYPIHSYASKKLVIYMKNELDDNDWKPVINKNIDCNVKLDEKSHIVTITAQTGEEIERIHYMYSNAEYDKALSAYVIRRSHDQIGKKIFALVFSSPDLSNLTYVGIMKTPDENGFMPLWVYKLE